MWSQLCTSDTHQIFVRQWNMMLLVTLARIQGQKCYCLNGPTEKSKLRPVWMRLSDRELKVSKLKGNLVTCEIIGQHNCFYHVQGRQSKCLLIKMRFDQSYNHSPVCYIALICTLYSIHLYVIWSSLLYSPKLTSIFSQNVQKESFILSASIYLSLDHIFTVGLVVFYFLTVSLITVPG